MSEKNLKDLGKKIEASVDEIVQLAQNSIVVAAQSSLGTITYRIFNQGKDSSGDPIGPYTNEAYRKKRESRGLQVDNVDLQFEGNLFRSIDIAKDENRIVIGITNPECARISEYLEDRYKRKIFSASEQERDESLEIAQAYLMDGLKQIVISWGK